MSTPTASGNCCDNCGTDQLTPAYRIVADNCNIFRFSQMLQNPKVECTFCHTCAQKILTEIGERAGIAFDALSIAAGWPIGESMPGQTGAFPKMVQPGESREYQIMVKLQIVAGDAIMQQRARQAAHVVVVRAMETAEINGFPQQVLADPATINITGITNLTDYTAIILRDTETGKRIGTFRVASSAVELFRATATSKKAHLLKACGDSYENHLLVQMLEDLGYTRIPDGEDVRV